MNIFELLFEKKKMAKKDDPCWDGYHMVGTKNKGGKQVPNCVPESVEEGTEDPAFQRMMGKMTSKPSLNAREAVAMMFDLVYHSGASYKEALQQASTSFEIDPATLQQMFDDQVNKSGDPKFDKMLKGITGKKAVAKQQKADTKQQARDAFGSMFGGGNPADKLKIKEQGVAEGLNDTQKKIEDTINKLEDRLKHAKTDEQWDRISARIERLQAGLKRSKQGVAEGIDSEELANEVYAEFERIYPNLARRANEGTVHAAIMDVLNYGGDNNAGALAQDVARAVKRDMQQSEALTMKHQSQHTTQKYPDTSNSLANRSFSQAERPNVPKTKDGHPTVQYRFDGKAGSSRIDPTIAQRTVQRKDAGQKPIPAFLKKDVDESNEQLSGRDAVESSILHRIKVGRLDLVQTYGLDRVLDAAASVADWVGEVDEIGSSDISAWVKDVERELAGQ